MLAAALLLTACADSEFIAIYGHDQCHRLELYDQEQNLVVLGAEDIAKLPNGDLIVSAYDRRARDAHGRPPQGGVYLVPKTDLTARHVNVSSIVARPSEGLRPHGVSVYKISDDTARLALINRGDDPTGKSKTGKTSVKIYDLNLSLDLSVTIPPIEGTIPPIFEHESKEFCRANDLIFETADNLIITHDQTACDGSALFFERLFSKTSGGLLRLSMDKPEPITALPGRYSFPNGIGRKTLKWPGTEEDQFMAVAETRANQIRYLPLEEDRHGRWQPVKFPGSPDNMTVGKPGIIQVAVHPNLVWLALYRSGWFGIQHAPSRVLKVTGNQVLTLFDDPTGETFSAASVAVQTAGKLVLGSVGDRGLLVCGTQEIKAKNRG